MGHHSVYGHINYNFVFENIPKALAMVLNNQGIYDTSEKSARYTVMEDIPEKEKQLYDKWLDIFKDKINEEYPYLGKRMTTKRAQENARYMISTFTPTVMGHTINFRQLNYIMSHFDDFIDEKTTNGYDEKLKESMKEFNEKLSQLRVPELNDKNKKGKLKFYHEGEQEEFYNKYSYGNNHKISVAGFAQEQRHRTLEHTIGKIKDEEIEFFVPPILKENEELLDMWFEDLEKVKDVYPQATLLEVHESGRLEDFAKKCFERLCGHAQLEIMLQTKETLEKINENVDYFDGIVKDFVEEPIKCSVTNCEGPCPFVKEEGKEEQLGRKV